MEIEVIPCLADNYAYLVVGSAGHAVVVDPSEAKPVRAALLRRGVTLVGIWATHHHHDHVGGIPQLLQEIPKLEVLGSAHDANRQRIPGQTRALHDGDTVWFQSMRVRLLFVPGHTLGAVAYVVGGAVFSGDTLFGAGCGRLFEGSASMMRNSLANLRALPSDTLLYCGHEYTEKNLEFAASIEPDNAAIHERLVRVREQRARGAPSIPATLADECATNPFLRWDEPVVIEKALALGATSDAPDDVFAAIRRAKDTY